MKERRRGRESDAFLERGASDCGCSCFVVFSWSICDSADDPGGRSRKTGEVLDCADCWDGIRWSSGSMLNTEVSRTRLAGSQTGARLSVTRPPVLGGYVVMGMTFRVSFWGSGAGWKEVRPGCLLLFDSARCLGLMTKTRQLALPLPRLVFFLLLTTHKHMPPQRWARETTQEYPMHVVCRVGARNIRLQGGSGRARRRPWLLAFKSSRDNGVF